MKTAENPVGARWMGTGVVILGLLAAQLALGETDMEKAPPLRLPDVVVYGRDVLMVARSKGLEALYSAVPVPVDAPTKLRKEDLAQMARGKEGLKGGGVEWKNWMIEARAATGSFSSASFGVRQGFRAGGLHYLASMDYRRHGDWVPESSHREGDFRGKLGYQFSDRVATSAELGFYEKEFGYYGSSGGGERGQFKCFEGAENVAIDLLRTASLDVKAYQRWDNLDAPWGIVYCPIWDRETELGLSNLLSVLLGDKIVRGRFEYVHQRYSSDVGDRSLSRGLLTAGLGGGGSVLGDLSGDVDLTYQVFRYDYSDDLRHKLAPSARISYRLLEGLSVFTSYESGLKLHGESELFGENNYIWDGWSPIEDCRLDLSVGLGFEYRGKMAGWASVGAERKSQFFWLDSQDGFYYPQSVERASVKKGELELEFKPRSDINLLASFRYEEIEDETGLCDTFPYSPKEKAKASLRYTPFEDLRIGTDFSYQGRRFTSGEEELEPFALTGVEAAKRLFEHLEIWGRVDNFFDTPYETWKGYPMPGRSFTLGLTVDW